MKFKMEQIYYKLEQLFHLQNKVFSFKKKCPTLKLFKYSQLRSYFEDFFVSNSVVQFEFNFNILVENYKFITPNLLLYVSFKDVRVGQPTILFLP